MQCLTRVVARSARAAAEGYGGRRFASTSSHGAASAVKAYYIRQRRVTLRELMRLAHAQQQTQRVLTTLGSVERKLGSVERNLDKLKAQGGIKGFVLHASAVMCGCMVGQFLFGKQEVSPNST